MVLAIAILGLPVIDEPMTRNKALNVSNSTLQVTVLIALSTKALPKGVEHAIIG